MKNLLKWLQQWDVVWSAPLVVLMFVGIAYMGEAIFGFGFGSYDPSIWQAVVMASGIIVILNGAVWLGLYLNWRKVYFYYKDQSKKDFDNLAPWQRLLILIGLYCFYVCAMLFAFHKLV